jgi:hypothetical protein
MTTVVISPSNVANFPDGGGHFWVYMQYVCGLRRLGCEVYWLERFRRGRDPSRDADMLSIFFERLERYGLRDHVLLYPSDARRDGESAPREYIGIERSSAEAICQRADLLLNFRYAIAPGLLALFRRTALVDIDPGLLQFWIGAGQLVVPSHHLYFTTGETVGSPTTRFPDCGLPWIHIRPPVYVDLWPPVREQRGVAFTTISSWWGGDGKGSGEWITDANGTYYENTKRISFLEFAELPRLTSQRLELALGMGKGDEGDRQHLEALGWRIRHAMEVARTPAMYQAYIQGSRGEFSCAKPSCMRFQNAWISDRTLCYLASGKPVVVQNTGPSSFLPNGEGMFRFSTVHEAVEALAAINAGYARHCRAARDIVEAHFDATHVLRHVLNIALP